MDLFDLKKQVIREDCGISSEYGKIFSFIDFSNVNKWFDKDNQDWNNKLIEEDERITIDIEKLKSFSDIFSERTRLYYGEDSKNIGSLNFTNALRIVFGESADLVINAQDIKKYIACIKKQKPD